MLLRISSFYLLYNAVGTFGLDSIEGSFVDPNTHYYPDPNDQLCLKLHIVNKPSYIFFIMD